MAQNDKRGNNKRKDGDNNNKGKDNRGFASMDPERQREIARKGGQASHGGRESS